MDGIHTLSRKIGNHDQLMLQSADKHKALFYCLGKPFQWILKELYRLFQKQYATKETK